MRAILKRFAESSRPRTAGAWIALLCVLALGLGATAAAAQLPEPLSPIVVSQFNWLATFPNGGALAGGEPAGSSFAVNQNGDIIVSTSYGGLIILVNGQTGAVTTLATGSSGTSYSGVAVDSQNNYYVPNTYSGVIVKVPYVNGAYAAYSSSPAGACTGNDTVACTLPNWSGGAAEGYLQVAAIAFDAAGDFFFDSGGGNVPYAIFECSAACLYGTGSSTVQLYKEPTAGSPSTTGQLIPGGLAIDPWGDVFFTDSAYYSSNNESFSSNLNELVYTSGTGYAASPTVLYTETDTGINLKAYDDELAGVAVDSNGTVYFSTEYVGVFAFPNNAGVVDNSKVYGISNQGAKILTLDGKGNVYMAYYSNALSSDAIGYVLVNNVTVPASAVGTAATATNVTVVDNAGGCGTPPAFTFAATENGVASTEFAGAVTASSTCAPLLNSSVFPLTITTTPAKVGTRSAELWVTDTVNSVTGSATASGVGQGPLLTLDPGVWTSYTSGFTTPYSVSVDGAGDLFVADEGAGEVFEIASGATTPVAIGTGFSKPAATTFDANGNLYVADVANNNIVEIPNQGGVLVPASQSTLVASTVTFGGTKLSEPSGLGVGPDGVLYIADLGNARVVTYNLSSGDTGVRVTGLNHPWGVALDAAGDLYVANTGGGNVLVYSGDVVTTLTPAGVTKPWGVAVDPSGSVLITDKVTGDVVLVPNESGTLTDADAMTIEKNPDSGYGLALDSWGNIYTTDSTGAAVYAVQRTAGSVNFAVSVTDGQTSSAETLTLESAGNTAVTLATPLVSGLTGPFTEAAGSPNPCTAGGTGPTGRSCELSVTFAPTGVESGVESGSFVVHSNALNVGSATVHLSGIATNVPKTPQAIDFTAPTSPVAFGVAPITLVATGGGSGNPVVFTVDGSSTGSGSIAGSVLTITSAGTLVIDANQAGNATYSAAPQVQQSIVVTAIAQAINFPVPIVSPIVLNGYPIGLSATATPSVTTGTPPVTSPASGSTIVFTVDSSSTATGNICPVSQSTATHPCSGLNEVVVTSAGTLVIDANLAGSAGYSAAPQQQQSIVVYAASPTTPISSPNTLVISKAGGSGSITITVTPSAVFTAPIAFSVSNLPTGATASFNPVNVTPNGTNPVSTTLTITTAAASAMLHRNSNPLLPGGTALALALCFIGFRKRRKILMLLLLVVSAAGLGIFSGCASNNVPTTTTVTVTATTVVSPSITVEQFKDIQVTIQ
jgi:sugar lactone lactonase YvrE